MDYIYILTINFFEANHIQSVLEKNGIASILKDSYHSNVIAGWANPYCNNNERCLFVKKKDLCRAKEVLANKL